VQAVLKLKGASTRRRFSYGGGNGAERFAALCPAANVSRPGRMASDGWRDNPLGAAAGLIVWLGAAPQRASAAARLDPVSPAGASDMASSPRGRAGSGKSAPARR